MFLSAWLVRRTSGIKSQPRGGSGLQNFIPSLTCKNLPHNIISLDGSSQPSGQPTICVRPPFRLTAGLPAVYKYRARLPDGLTNGDQRWHCNLLLQRLTERCSVGTEGYTHSAVQQTVMACKFTSNIDRSRNSCQGDLIVVTACRQHATEGSLLIVYIKFSSLDWSSTVCDSCLQRTTLAMLMPQQRNSGARLQNNTKGSLLLALSMFVGC